MLSAVLLPFVTHIISLSLTEVRTTNAGGSQILNFDDIPTQDGLGDIPSPYHHLSFPSYNVLKPRDPALKDLISQHDFNCAVSSPNALLGSRLSEGASGASFQIANATSMKEQGLSPRFALRSFYIKPMDAPSPGTTMRVKGFGKIHEEPLLWHVDFPSGYHLPFKVDINEFSGKNWTQMERIEIVGDFGYDALDWEFCIDDLEIQFSPLSSYSEISDTRGQLILSLWER